MCICIAAVTQKSSGQSYGDQSCNHILWYTKGYCSYHVHRTYTRGKLAAPYITCTTPQSNGVNNITIHCVHIHVYIVQKENDHKVVLIATKRLVNTNVLGFSSRAHKDAR